MSKPLEGIKVIEIAQEIQGPFAGLFLADLGAEITKVENRETGDLSRFLLAALLGGPQTKNANVSHYYIAMNRGKRSITVDLKKKAGIEVIKRLIATHDVLLTNYRPGVLDRLGLGYEDARKLNPKIVYAQASSWGPRGPWVTRPSRDTLAQAASGLMSKTGMETDPPLAAGAAIADQTGALTLAGGVLAALFARERTGKSQRVDASIYGTMIAAQTFELVYGSMTGEGAGASGAGPSVSAWRMGGVSHQRRLLSVSPVSMTSGGRISAASWAASRRFKTTPSSIMPRAIFAASRSKRCSTVFSRTRPHAV